MISLKVWIYLFLITLFIAAAYIALSPIKARGDVYEVTAYCACKKCCGPKAKGITASGKTVKVGMCAADKSIPFGTKLSVHGHRMVLTVEDRGGAIKGNHIDVYMPTHKQALQWGRRFISVEIIKDSK